MSVIVGSIGVEVGCMILFLCDMGVEELGRDREAYWDLKDQGVQEVQEERYAWVW